MSSKSTFKSKLAAAKLPTRTVQICLGGDLVAEHEEAERQLEEAQRRPTDSLAGNGVTELIERIESLEAQMREQSETFVLRALPRTQWRDLVNSHPPRRDEGKVNEDDAAIGLNIETFYDDMVRRCIVSPELDDEDWAALSEALTDRQFSDLAAAAWALNRHEVDVPFSHAASRAKRATADE